MTEPVHILKTNLADEGIMLDIATEKEQHSKIYVINLRGRIDSVTSGDFMNFFQDLIRSGNRFFILEASELEFLSSSGIAAVVRLQRMLDSCGGHAVFCHLNTEIAMLLEFFGLNSDLPVYNTLESAHHGVSERMTAKNYSLEMEEEQVMERLPAQTEIQGKEEVRSKIDGPTGPFPGPSVYSILDQKRPLRENTKPQIIEKRTPLPEVNKQPVPAPREMQEAPHWEYQTVKEFTDSRVLRCEQCNSNLRIYRSGSHMCPHCRIEFTVKNDGTLTFYEKLGH